MGWAPVDDGHQGEACWKNSCSPGAPPSSAPWPPTGGRPPGTGWCGCSGAGTRTTRRRPRRSAGSWTGAPPGSRADDAEQARTRLVPLWQDEFQDLLRRHPEAAGELRELIGEITASLTAERREGVRGQVQHIAAHDNSRVYAAQGGDVHVYDGDGDR
ncbi:hypothetical protein ACFV5N_10430 [Streptomyces sp. NPDC059853]|uniref:hypothetical protein n=1 Tax=Streptomyces sp. NPDC059853 TaxID=3346973 RepID=UPI00365F7F75